MVTAEPRARSLDGYSTHTAPIATFGASSLDDLEQKIDRNADERAGQVAQRLRQAERVPELPAELVPTTGYIGEIMNYWRTFNEASDTYLLASALTTIAVAAGPNAFILEGRRPLFLNLWSMIVGPSTSGRKSTALRLPGQLAATTGLEPFGFPRCTAEGLISLAAGTPGKKNQDEIPPQTFGLWLEDEAAELNELISKDYNAGLKSALLSAYDGGAVDLMSKGTGRLTARFEGLSILTATTPERLGFAKGDSLSGWQARWILFPALRPSGRVYPFQVAPDAQAADRISDSLRNLRSRAREVTFTPEARERYGAWYRAEALRSTPESLASNFARHLVYCKKLAALAAISEGRFVVEVPDIEWSFRFISWQRAALRGLVREEAETVFGKRRARFMDYLVNSSGKANSRDVLRKLGITTMELSDVVTALQESGQIEVATVANGGYGKTTWYRLIDDPPAKISDAPF